jgi:hypothetical protein
MARAYSLDLRERAVAADNLPSSRRCAWDSLALSFVLVRSHYPATSPIVSTTGLRSSPPLVPQREMERRPFRSCHACCGTLRASPGCTRTGELVSLGTSTLMTRMSDPSSIASSPWSWVFHVWP